MSDELDSPDPPLTFPPEAEALYREIMEEREQGTPDYAALDTALLADRLYETALMFHHLKGHTQDFPRCGHDVCTWNRLALGIKNYGHLYKRWPLDRRPPYVGEQLGGSEGEKR